MPTPNAIVRQLTARRFAENIATRPKKQNTPATACPRGVINSRRRNAPPPSSRIAVAMLRRQLHGVGAKGGANAARGAGAAGGGGVGAAVMAFAVMVSPKSYRA